MRLFVGGRLGCFHLVAVVNSTAVNVVSGDLFRPLLSVLGVSSFFLKLNDPNYFFKAHCLLDAIRNPEAAYLCAPGASPELLLCLGGEGCPWGSVLAVGAAGRSLSGSAEAWCFLLQGCAALPGRVSGEPCF